MKIIPELSYIFSEEVKIGINWFKFTNKYFRGFQLEFIFLNRILKIQFFLDYNNYLNYMKKREERSQRFLSKLRK